MNIPVGSHWTFFNNHLVTCLKDQSIPLNSKIIAVVEADTISARNKALIAAAPDLLAALEAFTDEYRSFSRLSPEEHRLVRIAERAIVKAMGGANTEGGAE